MPTTFKPRSAREPAISSPPTPIPRTMTSTRSAIAQRYRQRGRIQRVSDRFLERQRLTFGPGGCRLRLSQPFAAGSTLPLAEQRAEARAGRGLLGDGHRGEPGGSHGIAFAAGNEREVVELQDDAGDVLRLDKQF